jgi:hypothetical protein
MAQHIAQMHPEMGIDPGMLTPQAMSDENITALHELAGEATLRVALSVLDAKGAAGGRSEKSAGPPSPVGPTPEPSVASRVGQRPVGPSHAARGFTILGVE